MNLLMSHKIVAYTRLTESMLYAKIPNAWYKFKALKTD